MKQSKNFLLGKLPRIRPRDLLRVYRRLEKVFGYQHWWPGDTPLEIMVGAILTQNTAWTNVEKAIFNLKTAGCLSFRVLRDIPKSRLAALIRPAGYYNIKADRLKHFFRFLERECHGDLRKMKRQDTARLREKLLHVKGIGPETADSILLYALEKKSFVIDAYTWRVFSRHGLVQKAHDYHDLKKVFESAIPEDLVLYNDYHAQIVRLAKDFCRSRPLCAGCPLQKTV